MGVGLRRRPGRDRPPGTARRGLRRRLRHLLPPDGCHPAQPFWKQDANHLQGAIDHLDAVLRRTAEEHGATFVDTRTLSIGHDICAAPGDRSIEGLIPTRAAAPLHPNAPGARAVGEALAAAVRAP
ncbi:GDSL-type esterase/lipase family protein [Streptomyces sp. INA 01156]